MLARDVTEEEVFLVSSVLTLMWQEPNHVKEEWIHILELLAKDKALMDTVSVQRSQNLPLNYLVNNHERFKLYLSETQIDRLFQNTRDFTGESFELFVMALSTLPNVCFLNNLATIVELNCNRLEGVWEKLLTYIRLHSTESQINTLT